MAGRAIDVEKLPRKIIIAIFAVFFTFKLAPILEAPCQSKKVNVKGGAESPPLIPILATRNPLYHPSHLSCELHLSLSLARHHQHGQNGGDVGFMRSQQLKSQLVNSLGV
jgi:hypothetical protein